jgi:hypothetical protein
MSLNRLAKELDETTRQTSEMVDGIIKALQTLQCKKISCEKAKKQAMDEIVIALQAQDRIEQRNNNMAIAVRKIVANDKDIDHHRFDEIWLHLTLDELSVPKMSGVAARVHHGEVDLF